MSAVSSIKVHGELLDKLPEDLFIPPEALEVFLDSFEGPLDLLLYLIRKQNFDILDIPVAKITIQYMKYVELMRNIRLDLAAEYLVMAAMLAQIKSRLLLPKPEMEEEDEGDDPRAALIKQLQVYEQFRKAAKELDDRPRLDREFFVVQADFNQTQSEELLPQATLEQLSTAFQNVMRRNQANQGFEIFGETLSLRERMVQITERLNNSDYLSFDALFEQDEGREGLVVSFMAILELMRDGLLTIVQNKAFSPIHVKVQ